MPKGKKKEQEDPNLIPLQRKSEPCQSVIKFVLTTPQEDLPTAREFYDCHTEYNTIYLWPSFKSQYYYAQQVKRETKIKQESK